MAIQAGDVRAAYANQFDLGGQLQQAQKEREQKQLLEEERAQRQEDRDLKRVQTLSELEKPLYETTGTLYDNYKDSAINNYHKGLAEWMKANPNSTYSDQYRYAQQGLSGIAQNMEAAKLAQRHIDQEAKRIAAEYAGVNESLLASGLAKEIFMPNGEPSSSIDANNVIDKVNTYHKNPELLAEYYDPREGLKSLVTDASKLGTDGQEAAQWKGGYKSTKYIKDVERFNPQTGGIELNTDVEKVPITKIVNGIPTKVQQDVLLLSQRAFDLLENADSKHAFGTGLHYIHKMLDKDPAQKQLMDNMDETQLHRYLGAMYLQGANFGSETKDVTRSTLRQNETDIRSANAERRAASRDLKESETLGNMFLRTVRDNDASAEKTFREREFDRGTSDNVIKDKGRLLTKDLINGQLPIDATHSIEYYKVGDKYYVQKFLDGEKLGVATEINNDEKEAYDLAIFDKLKNAPASKAQTEYVKSTSKPAESKVSKENKAKLDSLNNKSNNPYLNGGQHTRPIKKSN